MSNERPQGLGINAAQIVPAYTLNEQNLMQCVQQLCNLLGAAKLGKASEKSVYVCGVELRNMDKEFAELEKRVKLLEDKAGGTDG